jgi:hypothetical protein
MRGLNSDFIAHEIAFIIFGNCFIGSLLAIKLHKAIANFQFDIRYRSQFTKAMLQVF